MPRTLHPDYLTRLQAEISSNPKSDFSCRRKLTEEEWRAVWRIVDEHKLAVAVALAQFGFQFSLLVYEGPVAPGAPCGDPLLKLNWDHLPLQRDTFGIDEAWEFCRPCFDTPRNRELLEVFGLPAIGPKWHYDY